MKFNDTAVGIIAAFGISVTAAVALPLVNVFTGFVPGELMIVRGGVTVLLLAGLFWRRLRRPRANILAFSFLFASANLGLYSGIRAWGANPTIMIVTLTPVFKIAAKQMRGQVVDMYVYRSLVCLVFGVMIALNPWQTQFNAAGFGWSAMATLAVGIGFEILGRTKDLDPYDKSFWIGAAMLMVGTISSLYMGRVPFTAEAWGPERALQLLAFGVTGGFLYILANVITFEKLKTEVAATLAMGETPAVIVGAWLMLGETMSLVQWTGVTIALLSTFYLSQAEAASAKQIEAV